MNGPFSNLDEFWPFYLSQHLHPVNRRLHTLGTASAGVMLLAALARRSPLLGALALAAGYGPAWAGHFFYERNRPATFRYPLLSFRADLRMFGLALTNQLDAEILLRMKDIRRYTAG